MPLRSFLGSAGVEWKVWSVIPGNWGDSERRAGYERRSPDPVLLYKGPERRASADRRGSAGHLSPELRTGWLVFESPAEKRRLAPIPPGWDRLTDAALERLCDQALPVAPQPADAAPE